MRKILTPEEYARLVNLELYELSAGMTHITIPMLSDYGWRPALMEIAALDVLGDDYIMATKTVLDAARAAGKNAWEAEDEAREYRLGLLRTHAAAINERYAALHRGET